LLFASATAWAHGGIPKEIAALDAKLSSRPDQADVLTQRAALYRLRGDYGAALADLNDAYELEPELPEICYQRGLILGVLGYALAADGDLSSFLELRPDHARALVARARVRSASGRISEARRDYQHALAVAPTVDTFLALGQLEEDNDERERAAHCYEKGLGALSDAIVLKLALIRVETDRRNYARAIELVDTLIANAGFKADALLRRADIYEVAGKQELAHRDRIEALRQIDEGLAKRSALRSKGWTCCRMTPTRMHSPR
jgi:tetratricopeptide (TPR) repeat protein